MNSLTLFVSCLVAVVALAHSSVDAEKAALFAKWSMKHGKKYGTMEEYSKRFKLFQKSIQIIEEHEKLDTTYELELNKFADFSDDEFNRYLGLKADQDCSATKGNHVLSKKNPPKSFDWRDQGVVSPVKNQGSCGSCWTFSTTGCLEAHWTIKTGKKVLLSEQNLVDCAQAFDNHGCEGGLPSHAFEYIKYNGGIDSEAAYPYTAKDEACKFVQTGVAATSRGAVNITYLAEDELLDAVAFQGPVSVAFQVASDFRLYKSGVYDSTVCKNGKMDVNHAVLATGYGEEDGKPYWDIKNSWGTDWGMGGYFKMVRGKNMCGIADCASYPLL